MFVNAIEIASAYTRAVLTISRKPGEKIITPGSHTLFFINDNGWAITSKRVATEIVNAGRKDKSQGQTKINFVDCTDKISGFEVKLHPKLDFAAIRFDGWTRKAYNSHAIFANELPKPGKMLCRIGYPFPEFTNFVYNEDMDDIGWTGERPAAPRFPREGMVTRLIAVENVISGIEVSTPGLAGMEGGPLFDDTGLVYGVYTGTSKYGLGQCVHMNAIKEFLKKENIPFEEFGGAKGLS